MDDEYQYVGEELDLFSHARRWKAYWSSLILPYVTGDVLDAGAGQGNNLPILLNPRCASWTALEPDASLLAKSDRLGELVRDPRITKICGGTDSLTENQEVPKFDCILYIDVMEHIEDDQAEFRRAAQLLKPGGHLIVLSPAFQFLFSPFDAAVGHFRRYSRAGMRRLTAENVTRKKLFFLDSAGFLLSATNRVFLRQSMPTLEQIKFWDRWVIPLSRFTDPLVRHSFGRSLVGIWQYSDSMK